MEEKTQTVRFNMVLPAWLHKKAFFAAKKKGISMAEYIKDLIKKDQSSEADNEDNA